MNGPQQSRLMFAIADEMTRQQEATTTKEVDPKTAEVDFGGYVIITLTRTRGVRVTYELHPKVAQRGVEADNSLIDTAKRAFRDAFVAVMKDEVNLIEE
jgi:hypothetical protein